MFLAGCHAGRTPECPVLSISRHSVVPGGPVRKSVRLLEMDLENGSTAHLVTQCYMMLNHDQRNLGSFRNAKPGTQSDGPTSPKAARALELTFEDSGT